MKVLMFKPFYFILMFLFITHCSIDTKSGLWKNKNNNFKKKKLSEINLSKDTSFNEFKESVILYGKNSKYPNLND